LEAKDEAGVLRSIRQCSVKDLAFDAAVELAYV
jgi:hypothetical protein